MIEKKCDLAVIGGGGSGMVAAVRAAQLSGKKVIVIEKAPATGGGMVMASTMRTFRSKWQEERNLPDVTDQYLRKVMNKTLWRIDPKLAGNAILATGQFFDWFCELAGEGTGEKFRIGRYVFDDEDGPLGPQMGGPGGVTGGGRLFMDTLRDKCGDFGVEVLTRTRAKDVELTDGKISAVLAEGPDGEVRITCSACVLAIGSWINNNEVMAEISPDFLKARPNLIQSAHVNPNYTGDGFAIAETVNAKLDKKNYSIRMMGPMVFSKSNVVANMSHSPFSLEVNNNGKRFVCEPAHKRAGVFNSGLVMLDQPGGCAAILFDTNNLEAEVNENLAHPRPYDPSLYNLKPFPASIEEAEADIAEYLPKEDFLFKADTVEDLAAQLGIDPAALRETIDNYNAYCAEGFDRDCFKEKEHLVPFCRAPYYAAKAKIGTDGAFGGILINGDMQAYRADGTIIENLYVTGDFASGRFINMAGVKEQIINDMSWALASGFLAGTNACGQM